MPVVVVAYKGPFADAVALYSQHLARPPSACRPPLGSSSRGRRRPRSASAAITSTPRQFSSTAETSAANAPSNGGQKAYTRTGREGPTTRRARPASAAAAGMARARPGPPRPSRPRPVTATGTRISSTTGLTHHQEGSATCKTGTPLVKQSRRGHGGQQLRRRVVSAGSYPSSYQGHYRNNSIFTGASTGIGSSNNSCQAAKGMAWEYDEGSRESTAANQLEVARGNFTSTGGSDFYHEHQNLGTDSEVMQRATEFVSKILKARRNEEGQQTGTLLPTPQCQPSTHPVQASEPSTTGTCFRGSGTAKTNGSKPFRTTKKRSDVRPVQSRRRKRAEKVSVASTTATTSAETTSTRATRGEIAVTFAANTAEIDVGYQTSSGRQQQPQQRKGHNPEDTTHGAAGVCEFPFSPGGTGQYLHDRSPVRVVNEMVGDDQNPAHVGAPRNVCEDVLVRCPASDGHSAKPTKKKKNNYLMTPLAFDVFCSMRPAFFKETPRSNQERLDPTFAPGGRGLPNSARGGDGQRNHQPHRESLDGKRDLSASTAFPAGDSRDRTACSTWTSVFGAVCAGAERGRARAEVLKAARREASRQKRRRRCASASAAAVPRLQLTCDTPASTPSAGATNGCAENTTDEENVLLATTRSGAENSTTDGDSTGETLFPEGQDDAVQPLLSPAPVGLGADQQPEANSESPPSGMKAFAEGGLQFPEGGYRGCLSNYTSAEAVPHSKSGVAETSPLFRHPSGGGTTRIGANAPRSLQLCPGDRGFSGMATKTSRRCFSSPRRRRSRGEQCAPRHRLSRRSPSRRPATASGSACSRALSFSAEAEGGRDRKPDQEDFAGGTGRGAMRPETAWSFFSKGGSKEKIGARWPGGSETKSNRYRGPQSCRWADGDSLRRRVDSIADAIAKDLRSREGTQLHDGSRFGTRLEQEKDEWGEDDEDEEKEKEEEEEKDERIANEGNHDHTAVGSVTYQTGTNSATERRHQQTAPERPTGYGSESDLAPTLALDADKLRHERNIGLVGALEATGDSTTGQPTGMAWTSVCAAGDSNTEPPNERNGNPPDGVGAVDSPGSRSIDIVCLAGDAILTQSARLADVDASPAAGGASNDKSIGAGEAEALDVAAPTRPASTAAFGSLNATAAGSYDGSPVARKWGHRPRPRPASAPDKASGYGPNFSFCIGNVRRSISSPGLMQGGHLPGQSLAAIVDIAEAWEYPDRRDSRVLAREASVFAAEEAVRLLTDCDAVRDVTTSREGSRVGCDEGADDITCRAHDNIRGGGGRESGYGSIIGAEPREGGELGRPSLADPVSEDEAVTRSRHRLPPGGVEPGAASVVRAVCLSKPQLSTRAASAPVSANVETPLEFRKATVKLKVLAVEASVAVDGHEKAWRNSKEQAEQTFNDLRFAAEEDAQRSGDGAATETRRRLQHIVIESGLENSRRVEKEAALEEIRRVWRQDTGMYGARASASENMLKAMRTLEAENGSCDLSVLMECRRNKSLILLRDRTERERDELRAACRRRREEAAVMDDVLAEARHARGLLLGHTQHTVERMACLAEYVSVMRRWLGDKLASRRHARATSKAISLEFEIKNQELDAILKRKAPAPTTTGELSRVKRKSASTERQKHTPTPTPIPLQTSNMISTPTTNDNTGGSDKDASKNSVITRNGPDSTQIDPNTEITGATTTTNIINAPKNITGTISIDTDSISPARPNDVGSPGSAAETNQSKAHTKNVAPPANSDLLTSLESLRDASSRLRGLLVSLSTHVPSAQGSVKFARAGGEGEIT